MEKENPGFRFWLLFSISRKNARLFLSLLNRYLETNPSFTNTIISLSIGEMTTNTNFTRMQVQKQCNMFLRGKSLRLEKR